jgi:hypothetical protein
MVTGNASKWMAIIGIVNICYLIWFSCIVFDVRENGTQGNLLRTPSVSLPTQGLQHVPDGYLAVACLPK